ncbi:hypothetical protein FGE12_23910 [Aggregicoccus sp. 17bor-14]|uniref:hypothetical protein n=1 Tax=Myxococcaceae TaxID=31 RepID=UPI00129CA7D6|nr:MULTISPECIES: hypothetical protein [Myxococcaceae]MBF5045474.1 hypothetical protein [Simulacricoccus sp. 17bor-14]MRI91212.1 hypothetical protein [Aggregicoccus sp. 17bor-14]
MWDQTGASRYLSFVWHASAFEATATPAEKLERLKQDLVKGIPVEELRPLPAPWSGWEWRSRAQGDMLRDRWVIAGTGLVMLQAVSLEADPFPEAEWFLDSLVVQGTTAEDL